MLYLIFRKIKDSGVALSKGRRDVSPTSVKGENKNFFIRGGNLVYETRVTWTSNALTRFTWNVTKFNVKISIRIAIGERHIES